MTQTRTSSHALPRYAVIGNPIEHSRSPYIHAMFAEQLRIPLEYGRLTASSPTFRASVMQFLHDGGRGLNVTVPFKQAAFELARDGLSARARIAGAVNTLTWRHGKLYGCNTDGVGLVNDLHRLGLRLHGAHILLIGAGGAARGALHPLLQTGCASLHIVNRHAARANQLITTWAAHASTNTAHLTAGSLDEAQRVGGWNLVINATASSLTDTAPDLPSALYASDSLAYDMMYSAQPTAFMRQALADGATRTVDGLGMLVSQAAESFFIWHGVRPDPEPVLTALRAAILATV